MKIFSKIKFKSIKIVFATLWWLVVGVSLLLLMTVLGAKFRGEIPQVFGYSVMKIVSGSMEPGIPTGSYILIRRCDPEDVKKNDIISFYSADPAIFGYPNTHRVIEDPYEKDGAVLFVTKGDANVEKDRVPASSRQFIGIYEGNLDWLTSFSNALEGSLMFIILVVLQIGMISIFTISLFQKNKENENKNEKTG